MNDSALVYASFMQNLEGNMQDNMIIVDLISAAGFDVGNVTNGRQYIELALQCEDSTNGYEVLLPKLRITC